MLPEWQPFYLSLHFYGQRLARSQSFSPENLVSSSAFPQSHEASGWLLRSLGPALLSSRPQISFRKNSSYRQILLIGYWYDGILILIWYKIFEIWVSHFLPRYIHLCFVDVVYRYLWCRHYADASQKCKGSCLKLKFIIS